MTPTLGRRQEISIVTPEGVRFGLPLAGPLTRFLAWMVDALLIGAATVAVSQVLAILTLLGTDVYVALNTLAYFVISVGYGIFFEWFWGGRTPGKRIMHLRVVDAHSLKLEPSQVVMRNLLRFVDAIPAFYLVGGAAMLLSRDAQRLGDMAANTAVIRERRLAPVDAAMLAMGKYNSLLDYPHLAARLRQRASPALVEVAIQTVIRRDELAPDARVEVFEELATKFRALSHYPETATSMLTR